MTAKETLEKINQSLKRVSDLVNESLQAGDQFDTSEIQPLIKKVEILKQQLVARLEKEKAGVAKN